MATLAPGARVTHANVTRSYGHGVLTRIVPTLSSRPPSKGYVRFAGESADRLVWLDDLTAAPRASDPAPAARLVWPLERAGDLAPVSA